MALQATYRGIREVGGIMKARFITHIKTVTVSMKLTPETAQAFNLLREAENFTAEDTLRFALEAILFVKARGLKFNKEKDDKDLIYKQLATMIKAGRYGSRI